ncbi:hypothetical protein QBZ16_003026 [Prototheca wickerhamii]|uniref:RRM domain-containing protein n=1 Tax=Prototheca wickerhamii TaxID=3111 RepID=A0AAD9ML89_PROWI|nr:hypothetical protein QBZ16_003026 [Prototheca wickerhamii]
MFEDRHIRVDRAAPSQSRDMSKLSGKAVLKIDAESKVTYDPARSVFAGNLPKDIEDEDVIRFFSDSSVSSDLRSAVEAVRVVRDRYTREGKGIAFVLYKTRSAARSATLLNGHKLKDRAIRVSKVERAEGADGGRSWQGARASAKGKGASAAHSVKKLSKGGVRKVKPKPRSLGGKRPAVAARKAQQKAMRRRG